jgi:hypothetical protein
VAETMLIQLGEHVFVNPRRIVAIRPHPLETGKTLIDVLDVGAMSSDWPPDRVIDAIWQLDPVAFGSVLRTAPAVSMDTA